MFVTMKSRKQRSGPAVVASPISPKRSTARSPQELPASWTGDVVSAAGELFLAHGYSGVSLEAVITKTGGSFRELYREFGSKEGLFIKAVGDMCDRVVSPWRALDVQNLCIEEALLVIGRAVLVTLLSPRLLALHRLVLSESVRFPELGKVWYEAGPNMANQALGAFLSARAQPDGLRLTDPCVEAAILVDSLVNNLQLRKLVGLQVSQTEIEERLHACVRVFLTGVGGQLALPKKKANKGK